MRNYGSHRPSGHFSDLTKPAKKRALKQCGRCGTSIYGGTKKWCSPCYDALLNERVVARRRERKAALQSTA